MLVAIVCMVQAHDWHDSRFECMFLISHFKKTQHDSEEPSDSDVVEILL